MKQLIALLLALLMLAVLVSCTVTPPEEPNDTPTPDVSTEKEDDKKQEEEKPPIDLPENLSTTASKLILKQLAEARSVKTFTSSIYSHEAVFKNQSSAADIIEVFTKDGFFDYPIKTVDGANFTTNFLYGETSMAVVYFHKDKKEVRVVADEKRAFDHTVLLPNAETDKGKLQFLQIGSDRVSENDNPMIGMIHLVKLSDGRAMIVDGGSGNEKNAKNIYSALEKLNIKKDEQGKYLIAAWILTHAHGDHVNGAIEFMKSYGFRTDVGAFIYHFCDATTVIGTSSSLVQSFANRAQVTYYKAAHIVPHAGMKYYFGNATVSMLYTPDLSYNSTTSLSYYNDSSLIFKIGVGNSSVFEMGDAAEFACSVLKEYYQNKALKSNVLQITHHGLFTAENFGHGWDNLKSVYDAVGAKLAILPMQSKYAEDSRNGRYTVLYEWCNTKYQISYVMNTSDKPSGVNITQKIWTEFEETGKVNGTARATLYGYDGKNIVKNGKGLTTYLGATATEIMVTVFELNGTSASVKTNQLFSEWIK